MSGKSWADYEEPKGPTADDVNPDQFTVSGSVTAYFEENGSTIQDYADLIKEVLDYPEGLSGDDYEFISSLAKSDEHEPLSPKQVAWLDDIEGKIG